MIVDVVRNGICQLISNRISSSKRVILFWRGVVVVSLYRGGGGTPGGGLIGGYNYAPVRRIL